MAAGPAEEARSFLNGATCAICTRLIRRETTKELIRVRSFKVYADAIQDLGNPTTRTRGTWCTSCTLWFLGEVSKRRDEAEAEKRAAAALAEQSWPGSEDVRAGDGADGDDGGSSDERDPVSEVQPGDG
jgi:hypothetical protein